MDFYRNSEIVSDGATVIGHGHTADNRIFSEQLGKFETVIDAAKYASEYYRRTEAVRVWGLHTIELVWNGNVIESYCIDKR